MKQKYLSILFSLIIFATLFFAGACNKEDSFDYGNYEPVLTNLTSDLSVTPMIGRTYSYKTVIRGGSTYQWTVSTGADVTNFDEEATGYVYVTDALVTGDFIVSVTETTAAGKVSEPFKDTVVVTAIFPFTCAGVSGDNEPIQTFDYEYSVNLYNSNDMKFSTYTWAVTGGTVTPDLEETYNAVINFTEPGLQTITVTETNSEGLVDVSETVVDVVPFCSLTDGLNDFVGTYTGVDDDDGWWYGSVSQDYTFAVAGDELEMGGMFYTKLEAWGTLTGGGTCKIALDINNPVFEIANQFYASNDEGDPDGDWVYYIEGYGAWTNCAGYPQLEIMYDILYIMPADADEVQYSMWDGEEGAKPFLHVFVDCTDLKVDSKGKIILNAPKIDGNFILSDAIRRKK